ncbi:transglutaminase-like domain-containing protein [Blastopirellula retiformator]|uniref:Transglutaminase-like superfamily protein n=1 Tax=Blastopirellula retiformator TaxID=2527970 RepID=A0A5C5V4J7_9BACT|nr:transglutaminase-like domain-containing protein [Blastopirellula retiformator]TWT32625.1 Transglutaminase-like superfamily protein [Blastopirellula retiformator]
MIKSNFLTLFSSVLLSLTMATSLSAAERWWDQDVAKALSQAGDNRAELRKALADVPEAQRGGMAFLIANMPDQDLRSLTSDFLLSNCKLAYQAKNETAWGKQVPEEIFLNDVLPYANLDEERDDWRQRLFALSMPIVKDCKTASEAALKLNKELFPLLNVKYSTKRRAPNQGPDETMESGVASCTGLSILLVDACRATGIPARVVGTPLWTNNRGNHTWVEIWDDGWHFTGACEAGDAKSLDVGWFVGEAAKAKEDSPQYAIYAASFGKTKTPFPMVWSMRDRTVSAVNVTRSYKPKDPIATKTSKLSVKVVDAQGKRVATDVAVKTPGKQKPLHSGRSKGESVDLNHFLGFDLPPQTEFTLVIEGIERTVQSPAAGEETVVEIQLPAGS